MLARKTEENLGYSEPVDLIRKGEVLGPVEGLGISCNCKELHGLGRHEATRRARV
jgi:hypothetical protein